MRGGVWCGVVGVRGGSEGELRGGVRSGCCYKHLFS